MNERSHEELSALMDGEASELEVRRTINALENDVELMRKWRRYHVARSAMQGDFREDGAADFAKLDISAAVSQALAGEPAHTHKEATASGRPGWQEKFLKPLSSVAVAASVSAMVVLGWQNFQGGEGVNSIVADATPIPSAVVAQSDSDAITLPAQKRDEAYVTVANSQLSMQRKVVNTPEIVRMAPQQNQRLNHYLVSHSGNAALNTAGGSMSYTRVIHIAPQ